MKGLTVSKADLLLVVAIAVSLVVVSSAVAGAAGWRHLKHGAVQIKVEQSMAVVAQLSSAPLARGEGFSDIGLGGLASKGLMAKANVDPVVTRHFLVEAQKVSAGRYQVRAWPKMDAIRLGKVAAKMYYVEFDNKGQKLANGWAP